MRLAPYWLLLAGSAAFTAPSAREARRAEWQLKVEFDSGMILIEARKGALVHVIAPTGTFLIGVESPDTLARWAREAREAGARRGVGEAAFARLSSRLSGPAEFLLEPVLGDTTGEYLLTGTNGAWDFIVKLSATQSSALFGALVGETGAGAVPYRDPFLTTSGPPEEYRPHVTGAWHENQVDRPVQARGVLNRVGYPEELRGYGIDATVRFVFIVDPNGRPRPSSIRLLGSPHRFFATASRDLLLRSRYVPAQRAGKPVAQIVSQNFEWRDQQREDALGSEATY